jgi:hypothetical protein
MDERFSKRFGHKPTHKEITIRDNAPIGLRKIIPYLFYGLGFPYEPSFLRNIVCQIVMIAPDKSNRSEYPNIEFEVLKLISNCEWYLVYDIIEEIWDSIENSYSRKEFQEELNEYFKQNGIGWKIENGLIEIRGDETFENTIETVVTVLQEVKLKTAETEIREAITDLSRRPQPDITGAIQHSIVCLECLSREITGDKKATLGELIKKYPDIVPRPLDQAIEKIWGYTCEQGRHLREGQVPGYEEAELIVEVTAAISTYLVKKVREKK